MKSKILVADDGENIRGIVTEALEKSDAIVESIGNGEAAFNLLNEFNADLVLVKSDIPGLSGSQLSEKIKRSQKYYTAKVILLISESDDFTDKQYVESMADDLVFKPFKSMEIYKKIKKALGNRLEEALEDVEMNWEEEDGDDDELDGPVEEDLVDDLEAEDIDLAMDSGEKSKEIENTVLSSPKDDKDDVDIDRNEYDEDIYQDESEKEPALTEAQIDLALIVNPPEVPPENVELSYFLATGDGSSDDDKGDETLDISFDDDSDKAEGLDEGMADLKRDSFFNAYVGSINAAPELKKVFEKMLYLDSYMREREVTELTESVTHSIQDVLQGLTRNIIQNIIKREINK